ncbi:hypothetical protein N0V83_001500 [Neocucurbitaria cava]|uniref:BRCT domain-containing protein n=1 Tax=Neocucurbitaria cava TaxID=798079 RepID=A0A9W8YFQ0_9PLEO|nr:hypothetical protein N0V83_001500 [Neocucurbitaria cava]
MGTLSKLTIAIAGTLPKEPSQIKKWVEANGGKWSPTITKKVTHLIASKEAWKNAGKNATGVVHQASDMGIWIVSYDWFEDSLQSKRKFSEKKYTFEQLKKEGHKRKQLKRLGAVVDGKKFVDGCEMARELTGSGTSNPAVVKRKPRKSKSVFFSASSSVPDTPFVSSSEDLRRRRADREAAEAAESGDSPAQTQTQSSVEVEDACSSQLCPSSSSAASVPVRPVDASKKSKSPLSPSKSPTAAPAPAAEPQAKTPHIKDLYHYYLDTTGFEYKIVLARSDFSSCSFARYHIGLLESHTKPHTYCTVIQYTPPAKRAPDSVNVLPTDGAQPGQRNHWPSFLNKSTTNNTGMQQPQPQQQTISKTGFEVPQPLEAARLQSLISAPVPSLEAPYKALICPMNSAFAAAFRTFRHAFRDLTLLTWEERFDDSNRSLQKARAQQFNIEPFLYSKPAKGMPVGILPQEAGYLQGEGSENESGYVRNAFGLPSVEKELNRDGAIGSMIYREAEELRKRKEEELRIEAEALVEARERAGFKRAEGQERARKPNYHAPMFNGVMGRPLTDEYGLYRRDVVVGGGRGGDAGVLGGFKRREVWPRDREDTYRW